MRRVVWQEEQAEKIRLQQQRQKLKEDALQRRDGGCWEHPGNCCWSWSPDLG